MWRHKDVFGVLLEPYLKRIGSSVHHRLVGVHRFTSGVELGLQNRCRRSRTCWKGGRLQDGFGFGVVEQCVVHMPSSALMQVNDAKKHVQLAAVHHK